MSSQLLCAIVRGYPNLIVDVPAAFNAKTVD